jgi:hypothetical protein
VYITYRILLIACYDDRRKVSSAKHSVLKDNTVHLVTFVDNEADTEILSVRISVRHLDMFTAFAFFPSFEKKAYLLV